VNGMIAIRFRFPRGRFHATPWGHSQFDGDPEWPPSVWRVVNAVVSTAYTHGAEPPDEERLSRIVTALSSAFPSISVPTGKGGRTQYYVPRPGRSTRIPSPENPATVPKKGEEPSHPVLIADPFVSVSPRDAVVYEWSDVSLDPGDADYLAGVLKSVPYLGRAESLVEGDLIADASDVPAPNLLPSRDDQHAFPMMLVCPKPGATLEDITEEFREQGGDGKGRRAPIPSQGTVVLYYATDQLLVDRVLLSESARQLADMPMPTVAILAMDGRIPYGVAEVEMVARAVRSQLIRAHDGPSPDISGKDERYRDLRDQHRHLFIMPYDGDGDGRLDHLLLYETGGFPPDVVAALQRVTWFKNYEDFHAGVTSVLLQALGSTELDCPLYKASGARIWRSVTPFVPRRYARARSDGSVKDSVEDQVRRELSARGFPAVETVGVLGDTIRWAGGTLSARYFHLDPAHGIAKAPSTFLEVTFETPVVGPLAIGGHSHMGFGILLPAEA